MKEEATQKKASDLDLIGLISRSFYLQAGWNYEGLQTLGFAFVIFPFLRKLGSRRTLDTESAARHLSLFNSNPVLTSYIIGATAKLEEERAETGAGGTTIETLKSSLSVPLAAMGDRFFWANLRPFSGLLGSLAALLSLAANRFEYAGALLFLALYNSFHLYYRAKGVVDGYKAGGEIAALIPGLRFMRLSWMVGWLGAISTATLLAGLTYGWTNTWRKEALLLFPLIALGSGLLRERFHKRITEVAIGVGFLGLVLTASGVFG